MTWVSFQYILVDVEKISFFALHFCHVTRYGKTTSQRVALGGGGGCGGIGLQPFN